MNQAKNNFEKLLVLHYKLCRAAVNEIECIGKQIIEVIHYVEKYNLFPVDLSERVRERLELMCERGSSDLKLEISKDLYLYLGRMMFSFEESNIIKMEPYVKLLELSRTEYPYEQANDWGKEQSAKQIFDEELFFFQINRNHISIPSEEKYQAYCGELRKDPFDIDACFNHEQVLPSSLSKEVETILQEKYSICTSYIDANYSLIKRAFSTYNKDIRVYILSRNENVYIAMINVYEGGNAGVSIYPNIVDIMYRFSNVEAIDERMSNSILTGFKNSDFSHFGSIFSIPGIHHELNRLFVRYASNADLTDYLAYILRGQLKRVSIISDTEIKVDENQYLLLFETPTVKDLLVLLNKDGERIRFVVFRSRPDDSIVDALSSHEVSFTDVMHLGHSLINNQNGEMVHWFIKERLDKIQLDDSYKDLSTGDRLIKQLNNCPKGREGWKQYEDIASEIFRFLFEKTFRNYTYEYQSSTSDGIQRRDLVVNNTYKDNTFFWQLVKNDYNANLIIVDFKNYREKMNSDSFYSPTKYLNLIAGYFIIVFSRCGLDDTAKKFQQKLLLEKKLVMCLTDSDLKNMINQKMNGQEPLNSLENIYYKMCKNQ